MEPVEIKKPAYVKVKTDKDIAKQKPADTKPKTAKESIPLIKMNEPVDINPVFVEPLNFDAEKEIVLEKEK
ncbi:MAG: hypothetical protein IPG38_12040 [Chitinophagaceae bacterium]|nr:hypothetical protein [Chitinophagaceae bacterium]